MACHISKQRSYAPPLKFCAKWHPKPLKNRLLLFRSGDMKWLQITVYPRFLRWDAVTFTLKLMFKTQYRNQKVSSYNNPTWVGIVWCGWVCLQRFPQATRWFASIKLRVTDGRWNSEKPKTYLELEQVLALSQQKPRATGAFWKSISPLRSGECVRSRKLRGGRGRGEANFNTGAGAMVPKGKWEPSGSDQSPALSPSPRGRRVLLLI